MNPIEAARRIHSHDWSMVQDVSIATKSAQTITRDWQNKVTANSDRYEAEFPVSNLGEKIDLVDTTDMIAYELKVSPNNSHFEFYRDVFKVIAHNRLAATPNRLAELNFLAPGIGAKRLQRGLAKEVCEWASEQAIIIKVVEL